MTLKWQQYIWVSLQTINLDQSTNSNKQTNKEQTNKQIDACILLGHGCGKNKKRIRMKENRTCTDESE